MNIDQDTLKRLIEANLRDICIQYPLTMEEVQMIYDITHSFGAVKYGGVLRRDQNRSTEYLKSFFTQLYTSQPEQAE
jgi:hypothetical protein